VKGTVPFCLNFVAHTLVMVEKILEEVQGSEAECCKCSSVFFIWDILLPTPNEIMALVGF
jgi:hypothetical protein